MGMGGVKKKKGKRSLYSTVPYVCLVAVCVCVWGYRWVF